MAEPDLPWDNASQTVPLPAESTSEATGLSYIEKRKPFSTARRSHKKSKTGCATCRRRRIKCDERHPKCLNCISHGVDCVFEQAAFKFVTQATNADPRQLGRTASPSPEGDVPNSLPILELELLHNFVIHTSATLCNNPLIVDFWRVTVVQAGLQCDYILRAILAVSALHLAYSREDRRDEYVAQGILMHQAAARSAMRLMGRVERRESLNLLLFSMLTIYFALASPRRDDGYFFVGESGFPDWAFLLGGVRSILDAMGDEGLNSPLAPFLIYAEDRYIASGDRADAGPGLLSDLAARVAATVTDPALLGTYLPAIRELQVALLLSEEDRQQQADCVDAGSSSGGEAAPAPSRDILDAMMWLFRVSDDLVPLLKVPTQEAVAIFAHFGLLLKRHEWQWWLQGWGDHLISRAFEILDEEHREWIRWPMQEVGRTLP